MADPIKVAVAGLGSIGMRVARALDDGIERLTLVAVCASDCASAEQRVSSFAHPPSIVPLKAIGDEADVVVECLPPKLFGEAASPILEKGGILVAVSVGSLLENEAVLSIARERGGRILIPSGAIAGLDGLRAAAAIGLHSVRLVTRKPVRAFRSGRQNGEARSELGPTPVLMFSGSAREAIRQFPQNINVAATVSLAGLGPDETQVEIWADPGVNRNRHELLVESSAGEMTVVLTNVPDPENPKTSAITAYSVVTLLQRLTEKVSVGS
jgi:aspartate dehydrogenase